MSEQTPAATTAATTEAPQAATPAPPQQEYTPPASQAELDRIIGSRLARERAQFADYDEVKARADRLTEIEDAQKTEQQRLQDALDAEKARAGQFEQQLTAAQVQQPTPPPTGRTHEQLRPGASPTAPVIEDTSYPSSWLPKRRQA